MNYITNSSGASIKCFVTNKEKHSHLRPLNDSSYLTSMLEESNDKNNNAIIHKNMDDDYIDSNTQKDDSLVIFGTRHQIRNAMRCIAEVWQVIQL